MGIAERVATQGFALEDVLVEGHQRPFAEKCW